MDYRYKSGLLIMVLISMTAIAGIIIAKGGSNIVFSAAPGQERTYGLTGAVVAEMNCTGENPNEDCPETCQDYSCVIACEEDGDCDDKIEATEDFCRNPGTEFSLCVNQRK